jgi:TatD DNase family protein
MLAEATRRGFPVAVGETGLDYYRDRSPRDQQRAAFWRHVEWAHELRLPLVVHDRDAHADVMAVLRSSSPLPAGGVMHCYSGDQALAEQCVELGLSISFAGPLTFPNAASMRQIAARLPLDSVLVETDCPYMAPVPHRGQRNEPAYVAQTARALAAGRSEGASAALRALWDNAGGLFWRQ